MIDKKVYGEGKLPCRLMLCGDSPGRTESAQGRPFVGASGADLEWVFLKRAARLHRSDFYITNLVKWRVDEDDSDPTPMDIHRDEQELLTEIELCSPEIIVAVGKITAQWFMMSDNVDLEKYAGVPIPCPRYPDKTLVLSYHPAVGLTSADRYYHLIYWCFEQVGRLVRGEIACHPSRTAVHYSEGSGPNSLPEGPLLAVDTEGSVADPWGLSAAGRGGEAVVLRRAGAKGADLRRRRVVGHNILHDIDVLEALDAPIDPDKAEDTMLAAYLLPWLPRKLKALAYKLLGVEQNEYQDIIAPAEENLCKAYLQEVLRSSCKKCNGETTILVPYKRTPTKFKSVRCDECGGDGTTWPAPQPRPVYDDDPNGKLYTPRSVGRTVRAALERGSRLRESWENFDEAVRQAVEAKLGRLRQPTLDDIPLETAIHYSAADADITLRVWNKLEPELVQNGLWQVYQIDRSIIPIINRMHRNGILIDKQHFAELHNGFEAEKAKVRGSLVGIRTLYGWAEGEQGAKDINPASPLQIAQLLYDVMKLRPIRGSRGTDDKTLEALKIKYKGNSIVEETIGLIGEYRELDKMDGTYAVPIPKYADADNRVHPRFLLHVTASGRIASRDFNAQNIPTRTERGRLIRKGFIAKPGCKLVSIDLDQIELRVVAHLSQDPNLVDVFVGAETCPINLAKGKCTCHDIHIRTAALIYGKKLDEVTTQERLLAKTINFLILYGGGPGKLQSELALLGVVVSKDECVDYINGWYNAYPGVRDYVDACHAQAKQYGYVTDLFGRRRYLQGVWSCVDRVREESLKWAVNTPDQGTAAGILKLWMRRIWDNVLPVYWQKGVYCEPLLTIHDEVIIEAEESICDEVIEACVKQAALAIELAVPIRAKGASAYNWSELK